MTRPKLTVVIGANGAGKTTWAREHRDTLPRPFYNADSIAEGLGDANDPGLQRTARELVDQQIESDLADQRSFGFESTYSGRSRPDIVKRAKALGYATGAVFLGTRHHAINITRVQRRVREGGHHIEASEVKRRWKAAWANLLETWGAFDTISVLDNSSTHPTEIARKTGTHLMIRTDLPQWAQDMPTQTPQSARARTRGC